MKDSITIVTIYETLGDLAVEFILEQTQLTTVVIGLKALQKFQNWLNKKKFLKIKNLIVIEKEEDEETCKNLEELGLNTFIWEEIDQKGKNEGQNIVLNCVKPDDIYTIN